MSDDKKELKVPILVESYGDSWHFKKKNTTLSRKYLNSQKITEQFLEIISNLTLEEILALKFEQTARLCGGKFYGFSIWHSITDIVKDALYKYVVNCTNSKKEAIMVLGVDERTYGLMEAKYKKRLGRKEDKDD